MQTGHCPAAHASAGLTTIQSIKYFPQSKANFRLKVNQWLADLSYCPTHDRLCAIQQSLKNYEKTAAKNTIDTLLQSTTYYKNAPIQNALRAEIIEKYNKDTPIYGKLNTIIERIKYYKNTARGTQYDINSSLKYYDEAQQQKNDNTQYIVTLASRAYPDCAKELQQYTQAQHASSQNSTIATTEHNVGLPLLQNYPPDLIEINNHYNPDRSYAHGKMRTSPNEVQIKRDINKWSEMLQHCSPQYAVFNIMVSLTHENNQGNNGCGTLNTMLAYSMRKFPQYIPNIAEYMVQYDLVHKSSKLTQEYIQGEKNGLVYSTPYNSLTLTDYLTWYQDKYTQPATGTGATRGRDYDDMGDGAGDGRRDDTDTAPSAGAGGDAGAGAGASTRNDVNTTSSTTHDATTDTNAGTGAGTSNKDDIDTSPRAGAGGSAGAGAGASTRNDVNTTGSTTHDTTTDTNAGAGEIHPDTRGNNAEGGWGYWLLHGVQTLAQALFGNPYPLGDDIEHDAPVGVMGDDSQPAPTHDDN